MNTETVKRLLTRIFLHTSTAGLLTYHSRKSTGVRLKYITMAGFHLAASVSGSSLLND